MPHPNALDMSDRMPEWLSKVTYKPEDEEALHSILSNWMRLHEYLTDNRATITEEQLIVLLRFEIEHKARWNIMERLFGRIDPLRRNREREALRLLASNSSSRITIKDIYYKLSQE